MGLLRKVALATGLTTLTAVGLSRWAAAKRRRALELPSAFVLELDLESADLLEEQTGGLQKLLQQGKGQLPLAAAVKGLHKAADDPRVRGLLGVLGPLDGVGLAQVQELRDGVAAFRAGAAPRGAFAVAFAESYGEMPTVGTAPYYLATSFDRVYMAPVGTLSCTGLVLNVPFLKGLLDRLKIGVRRFQHEEYKATRRRRLTARAAAPSWARRRERARRRKRRASRWLQCSSWWGPSSSALWTPSQAPAAWSVASRSRACR